MPQDPDNFTVAFREAMRKLRREEVEEIIRKSPNAPKFRPPKVSTGSPNPDPIIDEGEVRRRADLILADMELEKHKNLESAVKRQISKTKPRRKGKK